MSIASEPTVCATPHTGRLYLPQGSSSLILGEMEEHHPGLEGGVSNESLQKEGWAPSPCASHTLHFLHWVWRRSALWKNEAALRKRLPFYNLRILFGESWERLFSHHAYKYSFWASSCLACCWFKLYLYFHLGHDICGLFFNLMAFDVDVIGPY